MHYLLGRAYMFPVVCAQPLVAGTLQPSDMGVLFPGGRSLGAVPAPVFFGEVWMKNVVILAGGSGRKPRVCEKPSHPVRTGWLGSVAEDVGFEPTRVLLPARVPGV